MSAAICSRIGSRATFGRWCTDPEPGARSPRIVSQARIRVNSSTLLCIFPQLPDEKRNDALLYVIQCANYEKAQAPYLNLVSKHSVRPNSVP